MARQQISIKVGGMERGIVVQSNAKQSKVKQSKTKENNPHQNKIE